MWTDEHCTKRVCKSKVLRNGEAKSKIGIKEASKYLTICNNFNLPHFGVFLGIMEYILKFTYNISKIKFEEQYILCCNSNVQAQT